MEGQAESSVLCAVCAPADIAVLESPGAVPACPGSEAQLNLVNLQPHCLASPKPQFPLWELGARLVFASQSIVLNTTEPTGIKKTGLDF